MNHARLTLARMEQKEVQQATKAKKVASLNSEPVVAEAAQTLVMISANTLTAFDGAKCSV